MSKKRDKTSDTLKMRVLKAKFSLPVAYTPFFMQRYPEYDTDIGRVRLRAVMNLHRADLEFTEKIESLADFLKKG